MTTFEKLRVRIKEDTGLDVINLKRRYTGINMKATGAFCWAGTIGESKIEIGSSTPANELLKAKKLTVNRGWGFSEYEIEPS